MWSFKGMLFDRWLAVFWVFQGLLKSLLLPSAPVRWAYRALWFDHQQLLSSHYLGVVYFAYYQALATIWDRLRDATTGARLKYLTFIRLDVEELVSCHRIHFIQFECSRSDWSLILRLARLESGFSPLRSFVPRRSIDAQFCYHLTTVAGCAGPDFLELLVRVVQDHQPEPVEPLRPNHHPRIQNYHFDVDLVTRNLVTENANFEIVLPRSHAHLHQNSKRFSFKLIAHQPTAKPGSTRFSRL